MDFGPVVKPIGITVKKEVGKMVETSDIVRSHATREFRKRGQEPQSPKMTPKRGALKIFEFQNSETFKSLWRGASVDVGFIAKWLRRAQREVYTVTVAGEVTFRGSGHVILKRCLLVRDWLE